MAGVDTETIMKIGLGLAGWKKVPADSAVHVKGRNINKVLIAIDVGPAELILARQLQCDAVIAHHPIGVARVNFHKVFDRHVEFMLEHGISRKVAKEAVSKLKDRVATRTHADIYGDVVGAARLLRMPLVNIHQPCDEYMRQVILEAIKSGKTEYVSDIVRSIERIPEYRNAATRVEVKLGDEKNKAGRWALVVAAGTNGGYGIAKAYMQHGVSTVIYLHIDYGDLTKLREEHRGGLIDGNLIVMGHLAGDSIGLNGLADRLEDLGVETIRMGILPRR
ncbi:MAG TPA: Nif3-like dinuclear metal center hexameric protein [Nitrososphaera sp.]|nr:Nif3-like dinuclear metal center hexameric protein [Nitrososphaera sp.]